MPDTIEIPRAEYTELCNLESGVRMIRFGPCNDYSLTRFDSTLAKLDAARKPPSIEERALEVCRNLVAVWAKAEILVVNWDGDHRSAEEANKALRDAALEAQRVLSDANREAKT